MVLCPDHLHTHEFCSVLLQVLELQATCKSEPVLGLPAPKCSDLHWVWELFKYYKVAYFYFLEEIWRAVLDLQWKAQWKKGSQGSFWSLQLQYSFVCLKYENSYYE